MNRWDVQQVCLNGHQVTDRYHTWPQYRQEFCDICGAKTIHECEKCGKEIKGDYLSSNVIGGSTRVPSNCENCGNPFPWTLNKQKGEKTSEVNSQAEDIIKTICLRFHSVVRQMRQRHNRRPTLDVDDEYDVQDLLHCMLQIHFEDIRREEWTPSYAGKASRGDFLLKKQNIVIETKKTRPGLTEKELGDQLIIDIDRYKSHPSCKKLICFVYDPENRIINPVGIENDLNGKREGIEVEVYIFPK